MTLFIVGDGNADFRCFSETGVQIAKLANGVPTLVQIMNSTEHDIPFADFIKKNL